MSEGRWAEGNEKVRIINKPALNKFEKYAKLLSIHRNNTSLNGFQD